MSTEMLVLPRSTRFKDYDFAICRKIESPTGKTSEQRHPGQYNSPTTKSGEICVDGQWWAYRGVDCMCSDDEIAYAIRNRVVDYKPGVETRIVDGKRVGIPLYSDDEFRHGIVADETPRAHTHCMAGPLWCVECR